MTRRDLVDAVPVYAIHGVDGTGKTTQAGHLLAHLRARGVAAQPAHLRFSHRRSLPVLAVARLVGASWTEREGGHRVGFHDFRGRPRLGRAYLATLRADMAAAVRADVVAPQRAGTAVVLDRFVLDTCVDLSLKFGQPDFIRSPSAEPFLAFEPPGTRKVLLDPGDGDAGLLGRRGDLRLDPQRDDRIARYRHYAPLQGIPVVDCTGTVDEVAIQVREALGVPG